jgi:hypothetical protein
MFEPIKVVLESLLLHKFPISERAELGGGSSFLRTPFRNYHSLVADQPKTASGMLTPHR